ncbi:MAG: ABC transporter permease, partial [Verrucomicrobiota bacterium]|nr:ABC transporter permease [Verrucomicrobiota bacterium]
MRLFVSEVTFWTLIFRSLRFHARSHFGTLLGAAVGSAVLIGALAVGDSIRESLRQMALARLGKTQFALTSGDRFFREKLADDFKIREKNEVVAVFQISGTASATDNSARANRIQILGVDERLWNLAEKKFFIPNLENESVFLNHSLAEHLKTKIGETILLRVQKPSLLSREAPISSSEDSSIALRLKVQAIISDSDLGRFSLQANQVAPFNAFVPLKLLQEKLDLQNRANLLLTSQQENPNEKLRAHWQLADAQLELRSLTNQIELRSPRVFLDAPVAKVAQKVFTNEIPVLTYFVNELRVATNSTPYSMVTASKSPLIPIEMRDDEILINQWLA